MITQTITVLPAIVPATITPPNPVPTFRVGVPVSETFMATGCLATPCVWSASGLPPGLALTTVSGNGVISGTPTAAGTFTTSINAV
jgi:large repetitive protein